MSVQNNYRGLMKKWEKIMVFFAMCSTGLCCNTGWFPFKGNCYTATQHTYDFRLSDHYCRLAGGELAHAKGSEYTHFFSTLEHFNGAEEYWVASGSRTNDTDTEETQNLCPYIKILKIRYEFCSEKKYFICEMEGFESACPAGFDHLGEHCYRAIIHPADYVDASKFCVLHQGRLAILDSEQKEWEAKAAIIGKNHTFFVDSKYDGNATNWNNGKAFFSFTEISDPDENNTRLAGDCIGMNSNPEHPTQFRWTYVHCEDHMFSYLCEAKTLEPSTTTQSTTPTTTLAPLQCPHGYNWKSHENSGNCFWETTYETPRLNWFQAREFCQLYGGDLTTYENVDQETAGLGGARGHYKGLWIGLQRDEDNAYHWVDGTDMTYLNWDYTEPNQKSKTKYCVTHAPGSVKWQLDYCGVKRWFICKVPKTRNPSMPDLPPDKKKQCDVTGVSAYSNQWYEYEDHCYMVHESGKYTWDTARFFCQDNGAHMTSVHSFAETNFILSIMGLFPESNFWVGLSAHGLHSSYVWTDNSPVEFLYWADEKNEPEGLNTCVTFDKRDGSWNNDHCNKLQGVICKRGVNSTYDFATTEPTTIMPGNCEDGWYNYGNKCFKIFGTHWTQKEDGNSAKIECNKIGASLVSVHGQDEQDFLTDIVLEAGMDVWIGLKASNGGTIFHWSDSSRIDYTNWDANEPAYSSDDVYLSMRPKELCVIMENDATSIGKWNDINCSDKKGYICQKMKDPTLIGPYQDPFQCQNITGWYRLGTSCYGFFEQQNRTWLDAQAECTKYDANLITYRNSAVATFVKRKQKRKDAFYWIGVREKTPDKYEYLTGSPMFYSDWVAGQPRAASTLLDNCVATNTNGGWLVKSCKEKYPFICKFNRETEPEEPKVDSISQTCNGISGDWYDYGGDYCYLLLLNMRKTWGDSMHYCFQHGGHLASLHSLEQSQLIQKLSQEEIDDYSSHTRTSIHIGLGKKLDGSFGWVDGSPVDYTNWDADEPDHEEYECVEMSLLNGKWNDIECEETFRGFICSLPKRRFSDETPTDDSLEDKENIGHKLTVGGILGIFICVLVILGVIGMTVYYLRPTKQIQPKLFTSELL